MEVPMDKYILVVNKTNRISTIHTAECTYLRSYPLNYASRNSERFEFADGLLALATAEKATENFGFCGHCLKQFDRLLRRTN
jgi:hypothetical protein